MTHRGARQAIRSLPRNQCRDTLINARSYASQTPPYIHHMCSEISRWPVLDNAIEGFVPYLALNRLRRPSCLDAIYVLDLVDGLYLVDLAIGYHLVLEVPAGAAGQFGYNDVAVAEEVDVKIDVVYWLVHVSL